jgi:AAA family ATP:ADP antiporter
MQAQNEFEQTRRLFLLGAVLILAHQVAGKAVRDGLFLSQFSPADLPKVMAAAALISVLLGVGFARLLARRGPLRIVPAAFAIGGLLHVVEFAMLRGAPALRGAVVTVVYLHLVGFGAILLSGFWSVANEVFDPRAAKRHFGRITGAGTAGGIAGGLLAERIAALAGVDALLVLLALLHLATSVALRRVPPPVAQAGAPAEPEKMWEAARAAFRQAPFLLNLAVLVLLGTVSAALLDYLFKSGASAAYGKGPQLTRYFALFYTGGQVLTFAAQTFLTPIALRRLGLGRTMQWHSTAVGFGAVASMIFPPFIMAPVARLLELIFRGSFLRSSYELFFTPTPAREKRATKTLIDVSCDRMGDALGAGLLQLLLLAGPRQAVAPILMVTAGLAAISFWMTRRMDAAYSRALEHGLLSRAVALNEAEVQDSTTLAALLHATAAFPQKKALQRPPAPPPTIRVHDPLLSRLTDLRSGVPQRVRAALGPEQPFEAVVVPFAIRLLAWDEAYEWARAFLLRYAHRAVGQLVDALLDPDQDFAVRRRIPHILAYTSSQRAVDGLMAALTDPRFEIRFHCSRALEFLHRMTDGLRFDRDALLAAVETELSSSRPIWAGRKLLDREDNDSQDWYLDEVLRGRADKSLEHVFSLLAILLPAEPLKVAFRALHGEDRMLRGLALEFLEDHLAKKLVYQLRALLEPAPIRNASGGVPATIV